MTNDIDKPIETSLLKLVRDAGGEYGIAIGRDDDGQIVDVQVAAVGDTAVKVSQALEELEKSWEQ